MRKTWLTALLLFWALGAWAQQLRPSPGVAAPTLELPGVDGRIHRLAAYRGKVVLVNFWASWCEPCRAEIPEFIELQNKFRDRGLVFIGIAIDQQERAAAFSKDIGINYPVLVGDLNAMSLAQAAGNMQGALPFTVVIDRAGTIIGTKLGRLSKDKLEGMVGPLL